MRDMASLMTDVRGGHTRMIVARACRMQDKLIAAAIGDAPLGECRIEIRPNGERYVYAHGKIVLRLGEITFSTQDLATKATIRYRMGE